MAVFEPIYKGKTIFEIQPGVALFRLPRSLATGNMTVLNERNRDDEKGKKAMSANEIMTYATAPTAKRGAERALKNGKNPNGKTKFVIKPYEGKFMIDWLSDEMAEFASNEAVADETPVEGDEPEQVNDPANNLYVSHRVAEANAESMIAREQAPSATYEIAETANGGMFEIVWGAAKVADEPLLPADDEPAAEATPDDEPAAEATPDDAAPSTDGRRGKGRKKQGVLDMIERMLLDPSYNEGKGVTLNDMVTEIATETMRPTEHITATVKTQLSRMPRTRDLRIKREKIEGVLYYSATRA